MLLRSCIMCFRFCSNLMLFTSTRKPNLLKNSYVVICIVAILLPAAIIADGTNTKSSTPLLAANQSKRCILCSLHSINN